MNLMSMQKQIALALFALSLFATGTPTLRAQATFEGTIEWTMLIPKSDPVKHPMTINVKGAKSVMEMDMGRPDKLRIYKDVDAKKTYMLLDRQHSAQELPYIEDVASSASPQALDLKHTGSSADAGGHNAQEYLVKCEQDDVPLWVRSEFTRDV